MSIYLISSGLLETFEVHVCIDNLESVNLLLMHYEKEYYMREGKVKNVRIHKGSEIIVYYQYLDFCGDWESNKVYLTECKILSI